MKKLELFGMKFSFRLERKNKDDAEAYSSEYFLKEKILYLLLVMMLIALSSKFFLLSPEGTYKIGDVVTYDIYAPKSIVFNDKQQKEAIIEEMILNSGKEYIFVEEVGKIYLENFNLFFDELLKLKTGEVKELDRKLFEKDKNKKISDPAVDEILKMSEREIKKLKTELSEKLTEIYKEGVFQEKSGLRFKPETTEKMDKLSPLKKEIVVSFLTPNYIYDEEKTKGSIKEKVSQIEDQLVDIKAGTLIVKKGELISEKKLQILEAFGSHSYKKSIFMFFLNLIYAVSVTSIFYLFLNSGFKKEMLNKSCYRSTFLILVIALVTYRFVGPNYFYLVPIDVILFLMSLLVSTKYAFMISMALLAYLMPMTDYSLIFFTINTMAILLGGYLIKKVNTRGSIIATGIQLSIFKVLLFLMFSFFLKNESVDGALKSGEILITGVFSGMITIAFLPYFEKTFNMLTMFSLLELGDLSHPLLKELSMKAPGTFHHSNMVAILAESAAEAIGANAVFARVGSYYHDIGKLKRPKFFIENQEGMENPHDKISPSLSALIIISHTRDGAEMAKNYKIPKEIRDVMYEHHGTTLLTYFYNKAKQQDPSVQEEDFRYSGPKPSSKESAIIMLADSIEAAVRSLSEKTPITIENMIRKIINSKIEDNQLSEADLTFKEIEIIIKTFTKALVGIHHVRIKYPGQK